MPKPKKGESKRKFLDRCIPVVIAEGKPQDQAIAQCINLFESQNKEVELMGSLDEVGVTLTLEGKEEFIEGLEEVEQKVESVSEKVSALGDEVKSMHEEEKPEMVYAAMSFAELEALEQAEEQAYEVRELTEQFGILAKNIMYSDTEDKEGALVSLANEYTAKVGEAMKSKERWRPITDFASNFLADIRKSETPMKTEGGVKYPASDYAYVPDKEKPSTWKLRMSEGKPGNITVAQLGKAAAAFSSGGFRGNKVDLPADKVASVKSKLRAEYKKLDAKPPDSIKKESSFMLWKEADGTYHFIANYSNNFRDNDKPPEIISEKSHKRFDALLTKGDVPLPDVWLWHVPEWKIGKVTAHAYDDSGFAIAYGEIENKEIAEWLLEQGEKILVSHGMPNSSIVRDKEDSSIIVEHITREISPLPAWAAANKLTGFVVLKEVNQMSIPKEKRDSLIAQGLSADILDVLENANSKTAKKAKEVGLESKEVVETSDAIETHNKIPQEEDQVMVEDVDNSEVEEDVKEQQVEEVVAEEVVEPAAEVTSKEEIAAAILEAQKQTNEVLTKQQEVISTLIDAVNVLKSELDELKKEDSEKIADKSAATPGASLIDLIRGKSIVGNELAKLDGRTTLAKSGPVETKEESETPSLTPIPFINNMLFQKKQ